MENYYSKISYLVDEHYQSSWDLFLQHISVDDMEELALLYWNILPNPDKRKLLMEDDFIDLLDDLLFGFKDADIDDTMAASDKFRSSFYEYIEDVLIFDIEKEYYSYDMQMTSNDEDSHYEEYINRKVAVNFG